MMALTERMLDHKQNAIGNRLAQAAIVATEAIAPQGRAATPSAADPQFLADELLALRRDQAKLQQAIF